MGIMFEKNPLFISYDNHYIDPDTAREYGHIFIIGNPTKYVEKADEIEGWLKKNIKDSDYFIKGMVIGFVNRDQATLFKMTWAE